MKGACANIMNDSIKHYKEAYKAVIESSFNPQSYKTWFIEYTTFSNWMLNE